MLEGREHEQFEGPISSMRGATLVLLLTAMISSCEGKEKMDVRDLNKPDVVEKDPRVGDLVEKIREFVKRSQLKGDDLGEETVAPGRWLWSMANDLLKRSEGVDAIEYFQDKMKTRSEKVAELEKIIIKYNLEKGNKAFKGANEETGSVDLDIGDTVLIPEKKYVVEAVKVEEKTAEPPTDEKKPKVEKKKKAPKISKKNDVLPKGVAMYGGPNAAALEKEGRQTIVHSGKAPEIVIPQVKGRDIDISRKPTVSSKKMPAKNVGHIVLHSTMGANKFVKKRNVHFYVEKDGTIKQFLKMNIGVNHAGHSGQKRTMSEWNDDGKITYKSIGIEVETADMEEWSEAQYKALKKLVEWLGAKFEVPKGNVLTHSQIAYSRFGRGRKMDPVDVDWDKLGLPNNYLRIDPDVVGGEIESNIVHILAATRVATCKEHGLSPKMYAGLKLSHEQCVKSKKCTGVSDRKDKKAWEKKLKSRAKRLVKTKCGKG